MTDTSAAWRAAGERFAALGASLKAHYDEQRDAPPETDAPDLGEAARRFAGAIQDAVDAVGAAARNPEVTQEARDTGAAVADALGATFAEVAAELHRLAEGTRREGAAGAGTDEGAPDAGAGDTAGAGAGDTGGTEPPRLEPWGTP